MELKNALAVCLISFFSATLVVLIVRALDSHRASQQEPQSADDALMVYYFHGVRCETCRAAESNAHDTLKTQYASQLRKGEMVWKVLDYVKDPTAKAMAKDFDVLNSTIVLVRMKGGKIDAWNRLDRVLALAKDKEALSAYLQEEINEMLKAAEPTPDPAPEPEPAPEPDPAQSGDLPAIPVPGTETDELPLPTGPAGIPIPQ